MRFSGKQILIALDQLFNTLAGGYADETLSARIYRRRHASWWWDFLYRLVNALFFWQDNHCLDSYMSELNRRHLPHAYRSES